MATHNVDDGTGGLDGSIVYELGRPEVSILCLLPEVQGLKRALCLELWSRLQQHS